MFYQRRACAKKANVSGRRTSTTTSVLWEVTIHQKINAVMSEDLSLVCQLMYFSEGFVNLGDEEKVTRLEKQLSEWKRDVVDKQTPVPGAETPTKQTMASDMWNLKNQGDGYWCQGEECECQRSHWVRHSDPNFISSACTTRVRAGRRCCGMIGRTLIFGYYRRVARSNGRSG